jgi:hypothetical protein
VSFPLVAVDPFVSLILINSAVMVRKASSTFDAFFAEVSKNGIPKLSAKVYPEDKRVKIERGKMEMSYPCFVTGNYFFWLITFVSN